jgi:hypothetical protein
MDDSTLTVGNRCIFPIFFAAYHYAPQKIKKLPSISHSSRNEPHNPTASWINKNFQYLRPTQAFPEPFTHYR